MPATANSFTLSHLIPAAPEAVYAYFSNPSHTQALQPYVRSVVQESDTEQAGVRVIRFVAVEQVPMLGGWWKQPNRIAAEWRLTQPPLRMEATAYSKPGVHLHIYYTFAPTTEGNTLLTLDIHWRAAWLLRRMVPREVRKAQQTLLHRLADHFASASL